LHWKAAMFEHCVGDVARRAAPGIPNTRLVGDLAGKQSERGSICFGENAKRLPVQSGSKGASVTTPGQLARPRLKEARQEK
jgi:hypothetical protein